MMYTREMMIKALADKTGYWKKDVRGLFYALDELVEELFGQVTDDEDITIQLVKGVKLKVKVVPARMRVNPKTQEPVEVKPTCKPQAVFSEDLRNNTQAAYEAAKSDT